ncbi:DUF1802 family protein [Paenibacillus spongiae]|uniref:DUF1802 family protein n=1 Tax=Paenibacillus spongiae TaxID=2909671 RepID=A0ABY5SGJ6_9BACL|nr:DUF1802 family protein [Paenibacillus spongiae]UVI31842.1 DUF1802 family protein [Paenibacillus spongiae]
MTDLNEAIALKEWAVAVDALTEGKQILVLRKGGIAEETRDFRLVSPRFYLLPAYEHQKPELLKEEHRGGISRTLERWDPQAGTVQLRAYAEAVDDIEIHDQTKLDKIREYHIWTDTFAEERLRWRRTKPLHLLLLRVGILANPIEIPMREAYSGCKSWVQIEEGVSMPETRPVLEDQEFNARVNEIRSALKVMKV